MKRLFDRLMLWLYLAGFKRLAWFVGRFGHRPQLIRVSSPRRPTRNVILDASAPPDIHQRDTLPSIAPVRSGLGWSLDELPNTGPLKIVEFDSTFNNPDLEPNAYDINFPKKDGSNVN